MTLRNSYYTILCEFQVIMQIILKVVQLQTRL